MPPPPPPPRLRDHECGGLLWDSDFDGGNAMSVEQKSEDHFILHTSADCEGTPEQAGGRTWFGFSVRGAERGRVLTLEVRNMNCQGKLFRWDMRPVWRCLPSKPAWERVRTSVSTSGTKEGDDFVLRFRHKAEAAAGEALHFAFCYPFTYADVCAQLARLDALFAQPPAAADSLGPPPRSAADREVADAAVATAAAVLPLRRPAGVYYRRECLCRSLDGRRVELLTVTSSARQLAEREAPIGGCFPDGGERPHRFERKRVFFISARVHPGEVPASHVLHGLLAFLLRDGDPRAAALRDRFVFKFVPMLNPDGCARGHYRSDTLGLNLNRVYLTATPDRHPTIVAASAALRQLHERGELAFYIDCHGHATKRGCFLYGNGLPPERQLETVLYAKLVALNSRFFDFGGCVFYLKNNKKDKAGETKEGSGRVAVYKMTDMTYCYTLECNYNMGRVVNALPARHVPTGKDRIRNGAMSPEPPRPRGAPPKYTPESWADVGKALGLAALDVSGANPASRLGAEGAGMARLRASVGAWVRTQARKQEARAAKRAAAAGSSDEDDDEEEAEEEEDGGAAAGMAKLRVGGEE